MKDGFWISRLIAGELDSRFMGAEHELAAAFRAEAMKRLAQPIPAAGALVPDAVPLVSRAGIDNTTSNMNLTFAAGFWPKLLANAGACALASHVDARASAGTIIKGDTTATAVWVPENPGSDVGASNMTVKTQAIAMRTIMATTSVSRQALFSAAGGDFNLEQVIQNDIARAIGLALSQGAVTGSGTSNEPLGIFTNAAIATVALGTNGAILSLDNVAEIRRQVGVVNADRAAGNMAWMVNANTAARARRTQAFSGAGVGLMSGGQMVEAPVYQSEVMPNNLTKGTSTTVCSGLIFGAWADLAISSWLPGIEIIVDPFTAKKTAMVEITAKLWCDVEPIHPESFIKVLDALT